MSKNINILIDDDLHYKLKSEALKNDITMKENIIKKLKGDK